MTANAQPVLIVDNTREAEIGAKTNSHLEQARALKIYDAEEYKEAAEFGKGLKSLLKEIDETFDPIIASWNKGHKQSCATKKRHAEPVEKAIELVKEKMLAWQRTEKERQDKLLRDREAAAKRAEEERRLEEAQDLQDEGDLDAAIATLSAPIIPPPVIRVAQPVAPKVAGVATTARWTIDENSIDLVKVICHIAGVEKLARPELVRLLQLDTKAVRQLVTALREGFNVPGITAYQAENISLGSSR